MSLQLRNLSVLDLTATYSLNQPEDAYHKGQSPTDGRNHKDGAKCLDPVTQGTRVAIIDHLAGARVVGQGCKSQSQIGGLENDEEEIKQHKTHLGSWGSQPKRFAGILIPCNVADVWDRNHINNNGHYRGRRLRVIVSARKMMNGC